MQIQKNENEHYAMKVKEQLSFFTPIDQTFLGKNYYEKLTILLKSDLDFHNQTSNYLSHNFHSFPAKFPPQLPQKFIRELTVPGEVVLDPMMGSGTTVVEAFLLNRLAIGLDIDPLALKIARAKTTPLNRTTLVNHARTIFSNARNDLETNPAELEEYLNQAFDLKTRHFIQYWFHRTIQLELVALLRQIQSIQNDDIRNFFEVIFSSLIITKSGGVSLALDLAHTRPHRAKVLLDKTRGIIFGEDYVDNNSRRLNYISKMLKSPLQEFEKKFHQNLGGLINEDSKRTKPTIEFGDLQNMRLDDESVDLIITSPPYASNAIDYMRAHKFSLVWLGYPIDELAARRKEYIGGESFSNFSFETLPEYTARKIFELSRVDQNRGHVLQRYFSEMTRVLREMFRVLKPQKAAIVVVGNSTMKGVDTETPKCLAEIGGKLGFVVPHIGVRSLDRNKRMLPTGSRTNLDSQIQQRMHKEFVIGFFKP